MVKYKRKFSILSHFINHAYVKTNKQHIVIFWKSRSYLSWSRETPIRIIWDFTDASFRIPCPKKKCPISQVTSSRNFCCYWIFIWFYQADTASSPRCYCSISRINNRRFSSQNNPPAWPIHSLKSIHSHSTLSHTDIYGLGASLCYSATSSITGKSVRHLEWIRNSCYCIEVLPRVQGANERLTDSWTETRRGESNKPPNFVAGEGIITLQDFQASHSTYIYYINAFVHGCDVCVNDIEIWF